MRAKYCEQNDGDCTTCALVSYGQDCHNNAVAQVKDGRCQCGHPVVYCEQHRDNYEGSYIARARRARSEVAPGLVYRDAAPFLRE